jgi:membrane-bound lytic murein transglycosylase MltF
MLILAVGMEVNASMKWLYLVLALMTVGCSAPKDQSATQKQAELDALPPPAYLAAIPEDLRGTADKPFTGDLDGMIPRRLIRAGVPFNRTFYFIDRGQQRGLSYEYLMLFQDELNKKFGPGELKVHVVMLPMSRDALLPSLREGKVDLVAAQLTVTPERLKLVDFSNPTRSAVNEVVVTGPGSPPVTKLEDLSGKTVMVRKGSSYYASLQAFNDRLKAQGKPPVIVDAAPESLEDDDLLEMLNAGLIPATVVDSYLADYWKQVFPDLKIHNGLTLRAGGNLAVAIRKNSPKLAAELNAFIAGHGLDTATGRVLSKRYLQSTSYVKNAAADAERTKLKDMVALFQRYGDQYSFDYMLMAAQGYQESRLDNNAASPVGAIGVMQLMPETGKEQGVGDVHQLEPNIHAGVKYMRFVRDRYFEDQPMDGLNKALFTFAAYNAGPGRVRQLRREAELRGLNPNIWFGNVERIASERIGRETVTYVSNIYKYYLAYRLMTDEIEHRTAAKSGLAKKAPSRLH